MSREKMRKLRGVRRPAKRRRVSGGGACPFSSSCFECPKADCVCDGSYYFNEILDRDTYAALVGIRPGPGRDQ